MSDKVTHLVAKAKAEADADFRQNIIRACDLAERELKQRDWLWPGWLPRGEPSMTGGPPGAGKSLLTQGIATGLATGNVFGADCEPVNCLYLTCEDDLDELHRRQEAINRSMGLEYGDIGNLLLRSYRGHDARLALNVSGALIRTPRHEELCDLIDTNNLSFVCLDLIPDFFDGNENVRNEVNRFVKGILGGIASRYSCAINFLYHPSRSGLADGSGLSGSTAWEGSVRSRLYLSGEDENGIRTLDRKKSNYSGKNSGFNLKWHEGAMVPTDDDRIPDRKSKPMGEYAAIALDALNNIYKGVPVSLDSWRDQFNTIYQQRKGRAITPENWRSAKAQLGKRGLVDEVEGRAFPRDE